MNIAVVLAVLSRIRFMTSRLRDPRRNAIKSAPKAPTAAASVAVAMPV
jgi:hypothetical protein